MIKFMSPIMLLSSIGIDYHDLTEDEKKIVHEELRKLELIGKIVKFKRRPFGLFFIYNFCFSIHISYLKCNLMTMREKRKGRKITMK